MKEVIPISEYGFKIKNIEASTLFEYNNGVRERYECRNAMFPNSLFGDFLLENGLKLQKDGSTRDIICLEFNYGSRSYEDEKAHLTKTAKAARLEYKLARSLGSKTQIQKKAAKRRRIATVFREAGQRREQYQKQSKEELRRLFYNNGVDVEYIARKSNGDEKSREQIHYRMLFRSTGKAKKGSCMFICDRLYQRAIRFLYMGIRLPHENARVVEISAYAPLISSAIVDRIRIDPRNILILKDVERSFLTKAVSVETDENRRCVARRIDQYPVTNTLFDGQALIDSSIFPQWANGYILLRHHFCKMASFCCHIQQFFRDYFKDRYPTATVKDMFGKLHSVKDIQLITTDNSMKWLKFDKSYDYWCKKVSENGCLFGIVKTAHESKLGEMQQMSYQMVNSLDESIMDQVVQESVDYVTRLKTDNEAFLNYLSRNANFSNDYQALIDLCRQNTDFTRSTYFRERRRKIIETCVLNLKSGKLIQNADNLVIVGSPYAMLLYAASGKEEAVDLDDTFRPEPDAVQCFTERFPHGEYLAEFRSPFNGRGNLGCLHNVWDDRLRRYFRFGRQIIAVNMIGTDFQDRNNGSDMDSDSIYTTNHPAIAAWARHCCRTYPTIVNRIPRNANVYDDSMDSYAAIDNSLARSQNDIGESSNLAQLALTYSCNFPDPKYDDYVCILSVLAQVAIDNAKRQFDIDLTHEIQRIKKDMDIDTHRYPAFFAVIRRGFDKKNINRRLSCPMNYLYHLDLREFHCSSDTLPMSHFFQQYELDRNRKTCKKVEDLISRYSLDLFRYNSSPENQMDRNDDYLLLRSDFEDLVRDIRRLYLSGNYLGLMSWLLNRAFLITPQAQAQSGKLATTVRKNRSLLIKVLYDVNKTALLKCFSKNADPPLFRDTN